MMPADRTGRAPEQKMVDPLTGRNLTGEYVSEKTGDFRAGLEALFLEIALAAFRGEVEARPFTHQAQALYQDYFQALKGATNLHAGVVASAVAEEVSRQHSLYGALSLIKGRLAQSGIRAEVMPPDRCYCDPYWDTGLVQGCNLRLGSDWWWAIPPVDASTQCYQALVQEPVAAQVIHASKECLLLLPNNQSVPDAVRQPETGLFSPRREITEDFPEACAAWLGNGFLSLDTDEEYSPVQLLDMKARYRVHAIVKGGPGFTARLYAGENPALAALLNELG
jgi:hypothetical protein